MYSILRQRLNGDLEYNYIVFAVTFWAKNTELLTQLKDATKNNFECQELSSERKIIKKIKSSI